MDTGAEFASPAGPTHGPTERAAGFAAWLTLGVLCFTYVYSLLDRSIIQFLIEPIKHDLAISDTRFSLLNGLAFLVLFSVAALPIGYLIDRYNRAVLIAGGVLLWSLATTVCGFATTFPFLFLCRAGVGIGEAVLAPAGYALLADRFEQRRHGLVLSIFQASGTAGGGVGFLTGGFLVGYLVRRGPVAISGLVFQPWQWTFVVLGIPGLLLGCALLLMRDARPAVPRRSKPEKASRDRGELLEFYRGHWRTLLVHHLAVALITMAGYAGGNWVVAFFMRVHHWPIDKIGLWVGLTMTIGATTGYLLVGAVGDWALQRGGPHWRLIVCTLSLLVSAISSLIFPLVGNAWAAMFFYALFLFFGLSPLGLANAALQLITPSAIRGRISANYFFFMSLISAMGPICIAATSDHFFPFRTGIRYALAIVLPIMVLASAACFAICARFYRRSVAELAAR